LVWDGGLSDSRGGVCRAVARRAFYAHVGDLTTTDPEARCGTAGALPGSLRPGYHAGGRRAL